MARYETVRAQLDGCGNACNAAYFSDTKTGKDLSPAEVCDLLNARDGMMTREQVWENLDKSRNLLNLSKNSGLNETIIAMNTALVSAYETVLNGGTK